LTKFLTSDLQETIADLCEKSSSRQTFADTSNWLAGGKEENLQIVTDEEIINNGLEDDNSGNEQESSTPPIIRTIRHEDAMSASNKCYKWAEENNVQAEDIRSLKRFQQKVLKRHLETINGKLLTIFFCKNAVK
jgi:hypothetical protein